MGAEDQGQSGQPGRLPRAPEESGPLATGSRAEGGGKAPAAQQTSEAASCLRGLPSRARSPRRLRSPSSPSRPPQPGASTRVEARPRAATRRPPLPPAAAASLLPPPARRAAAATARAAGGARNGARLAAWPGGGKGAGAGARSSRARGPRNCLRDHSSSRGAAPCWLSGRSPAEPPPAPGSQRQPGEGGRRRRAAAISRRSPARPRTGPRLAFAPAPSPDGGSALNLKIKLVFAREERARLGEQAALGLQAGEMLRHDGNMDAGLLSFFAQEAQASLGAPKSRLRSASPHSKKGKRPEARREGFLFF